MKTDSAHIPIDDDAAEAVRDEVREHHAHRWHSGATSERAEKLAVEEPLEIRLAGRRFEAIRDTFQFRLSRVTRLAPSHAIDRFSARHGQQPGFRILRTTIASPILKSRGECVRKRIFRGSHVSRARRQKRHELPVAAPRNHFRRALRVHAIRSRLRMFLAGFVRFNHFCGRRL